MDDNQKKQYSLSAQALKKVIEDFGGIATDSSLSLIQLEFLEFVDAEAERDDELANLTKRFRTTLTKRKGMDDVTNAGQAFEAYAEIKAYLHLRHHGFKPRHVPEGSNPTPDFECSVGGKTFYVEVKAFDIVTGDHERLQDLERSFNSQVDLREQISSGKDIATTIQEFAPYGYAGHGKSQIALVAGTWNKKFINNFKKKQFRSGPTFALAVTDRLILPSGVSDIAQNYIYHNGVHPDCCPSGALWTAAYAKKGHCIHDIPEFEGRPTHYENWELEGFFSDFTPHPAKGFIILHRSLSESYALGLLNSNTIQNDNEDDWTQDDTDEVLSKLCDLTNNQENTSGYLVVDTSQNPPSFSKIEWDKTKGSD